MKQCQKSEKYISVILSFCILFVVLYFVAFQAVNEIHPCTGTDCTVCHELQTAASFIRQLTVNIIITAGNFLLLIFLMLKISKSQCSIQGRTLISDKVRMDN